MQGRPSGCHALFLVFAKLFIELRFGEWAGANHRLEISVQDILTHFRAAANVTIGVLMQHFDAHFPQQISQIKQRFRQGIHR